MQEQRCPLLGNGRQPFLRIQRGRLEVTLPITASKVGKLARWVSSALAAALFGVNACDDVVLVLHRVRVWHHDARTVRRCRRVRWRGCVGGCVGNIVELKFDKPEKSPRVDYESNKCFRFHSHPMFPRATLYIGGWYTRV